MNTKLLSECGTELKLDPDYQVKIQGGDLMIVIAGVDCNKPAFKFEHPNLACSCKALYDYKHYRKSGSKFYTSKAGMNFYFIVPKSKIAMILEKGNSYVPALINGVRVDFNVSGGTSETGGWTDYLPGCCYISCNHSLRDLKKIAEVAVRDADLENLIVTPTMDKYEEERWARFVFDTKPVIENIIKMFEDGKNPQLQFKSGLTFYGVKLGFIESFNRRRNKITTIASDGKKSFHWDFTGAVLNLRLMTKFGLCKVKVGQIDWMETAKLNGM